MTKMGKLENYTSIENQNIFSGLSLHFVFGSNVLVFVAPISGPKSYGCDDKHANQIVKEPYFECFQAILYLTFICYHPVCLMHTTLSFWNFFYIITGHNKTITLCHAFLIVYFFLDSFNTIMFLNSCTWWFL